MKDEGRTPYRTITTSRFLFAAAGGLLLGIYFLYLGGQNTKFWINHGAFRNLMENLGGLLIVAAGLGVVWELFGKRAFAREVLETARVAAQIETTGLKKIGVQWVDDAGWNELFGGVKKLDIFVTYASTWRRSNLARLQSAANRRGDEFASSSQILMTIGQCNHLRRASNANLTIFVAGFEKPRGNSKTSGLPAELRSKYITGLGIGFIRSTASIAV